MNFDSGMGYFIMGGVVTASLLIYRIADHMLVKYGNGRHKPVPLTEEEKESKKRLSKAVDKILTVDLEEMEKQSSEMYQLHNVKDRDGVPIWYVRSSLEAALNKLITAIESQTTLMNVLIQEVREDIKQRNRDKKD